MKKRNIKYIILIMVVLFILTKEQEQENIIINNETINYKALPNFKKEIYASLEIPKISLTEELFPISSEKNNVNKSVEIIFPSEMPDQENSLLILAAHSGNSKLSFFKDLHTLEKKDIAHVYYNNYIYTYEINKIERQNKIGSIEINKNTKTNLVLTTCDQNDKSKQIVIYFNKIKKAKRLY